MTQIKDCFVALEWIIIQTGGIQSGKYDTCLYEVYNSMRKNKFVIEKIGYYAKKG